MDLFINYIKDGFSRAFATSLDKQDVQPEEYRLGGDGQKFLRALEKERTDLVANLNDPDRLRPAFEGGGPVGPRPAAVGSNSAQLAELERFSHTNMFPNRPAKWRVVSKPFKAPKIPRPDESLLQTPSEIPFYREQEKREYMTQFTSNLSPGWGKDRDAVLYDKVQQGPVPASLNEPNYIKAARKTGFVRKHPVLEPTGGADSIPIVPDYSNLVHQQKQSSTKLLNVQDSASAPSSLFQGQALFGKFLHSKLLGAKEGTFGPAQDNVNVSTFRAQPNLKKDGSMPTNLERVIAQSSHLYSMPVHPAQMQGNGYKPMNNIFVSKVPDKPHNVSRLDSFISHKKIKPIESEFRGHSDPLDLPASRSTLPRSS